MRAHVKIKITTVYVIQRQSDRLIHMQLCGPVASKIRSGLREKDLECGSESPEQQPRYILVLYDVFAVIG